MRILLSLCGVAVLLASASLVSAADVESGVAVDGKIGPYYTTKVAGCEDGVAAGKSLCYTCKLGARPVVFIFAKQPNDALATLITKLDKVATDNSDAQVFSVVNFTGEPTDAYAEKIKAFGDKLELKNTALTTTEDGERFKINDDADVTVMHYKGKKVAYNFATKGELTDKAINEIVKSTDKIVK